LMANHSMSVDPEVEEDPAVLNERIRQKNGKKDSLSSITQLMENKRHSLDVLEQDAEKIPEKEDTPIDSSHAIVKSADRKAGMLTEAAITAFNKGQGEDATPQEKKNALLTAATLAAFSGPSLRAPQAASDHSSEASSECSSGDPMFMSSSEDGSTSVDGFSDTVSSGTNNVTSGGKKKIDHKIDPKLKQMPKDDGDIGGNDLLMAADSSDGEEEEPAKKSNLDTPEDEESENESRGEFEGVANIPEPRLSKMKKARRIRGLDRIRHLSIFATLLKSKDTFYKNLAAKGVGGSLEQEELRESEDIIEMQDESARYSAPVESKDSIHIDDALMLSALEETSFALDEP